MENLFQQCLMDEFVNSYYKISNISMSNNDIANGTSNNGTSNNGTSNNGTSNNGTTNKENNRHSSKDINRLIEHMELLVNGNNEVKENDKPLGFLTSFLYPKSQTVTIQTLADDNINPSENHYVTLIDNENVNKNTFQEDKYVMPCDPVAQLYFATLGVLGLFILYRLMEKSR
jgi:hypothetical protein